MTRNGKETQAEKMVIVDDLEPYVRLIELQKQMIELVRQHERTKGECTALRVQLLEELMMTRRRQRSLRRTAQSGIRRLKVLLALWKSRMESRPQPNASLLARNRLLKI